jgi:phosphoribosylformylglycinamidine cyclo-ligase
LYRSQINGMIHCSGGAQTKILHFAGNVHIIKNNLFPIPPLFKIIQDASQTPWQEMYKVFNMGHRFELYVPAEIAQEIIDISTSYGVDAQIVGRCESADAPHLTITSPFGTFCY